MNEMRGIGLAPRLVIFWPKQQQKAENVSFKRDNFDGQIKLTQNRPKMLPIFMFLLFPFIFPTFVRSFMPPPLFGQCPPAFYPDGSCAILHLCVDPHERCLNGICCEPIEMFPSMPFGYNFGMPLPATHLGQIGQELIPPRACMDFEESCIQFAQMCRLPSVAEVCLRTCGHCFGGFNFAGPYAPYGGIGGPGAWMPPFNGK